VWFKARAWIGVAWLLCLANVVAVWFAARPAEPWHATAHALLAVLFGLGAQRLGLRKTSTIGADVVTRQELEALLSRSDPHEVTKALEAIAVEVERIGEGQRYLTKILVERSPRAIRSPTNLNGPEDG
jgi:hypothetical protein